MLPGRQVQPHGHGGHRLDRVVVDVGRDLPPFVLLSPDQAGQQLAALLVRLAEPGIASLGAVGQVAEQDRLVVDPLDQDAQALLGLAELVGGEGTVGQINRDAGQFPLFHRRAPRRAGPTSVGLVTSYVNRPNGVSPTRSD